MRKLYLSITLLLSAVVAGYSQTYTPRNNITGYPTFLNNHRDSVGVLRNVGAGVGAYGKVRIGEIDTAAIRAWLGGAVGGSADGNNFTTGISFVNQRLTLTRSGLTSLQADIDTGFFARRDWVRKINDSMKVVYANSYVGFVDTASMLSGYQRLGLTGLPAGGLVGQFLYKSGTSTYDWATLAFPPTAVADVTGLQDSLNAVRNASVPTSRTLTINGTTFDLTTNRSWTIATGVGPVAWGTITGNLPDQSDLQTALNGKANSSHTHAQTDITGLATSLGLKVNFTDTASMLSPYLRSAAAAATYQPIGSYATTSALALKVNISDTATMLTPYLRSAAASATYQPIGSYATTSALALKLNISDTASMLSGYQRLGLVGLPAGGSIGQFLYKSSTSTYDWATPVFPSVAVSDVTGLQDSLNVVRNAAVPTTRTINGYDLTANRTLTKTDIGLSNVPNVDATLRSNHTGTQAWSTITSTPTTLSGYGVSDVSVPGAFAVVSTTTVSAGTSGTVAAGIYRIDFDPASVLSTYTLTLPASPSDGQRVMIRAGRQIAAGSDVVTAFTVSPNAGQTLFAAITPTRLVSGDTMEFEYKASTTTWTRIR